MSRVIIGIQARSTSKRFPNKIFQKVGKKNILEHVVDAAISSSLYLNNWSSQKLLVDVAVVVPYDDPKLDLIKQSCRNAQVVEGPEDDVLARYMKLAELKTPDYICRLTADCPLLPAFLISKLITIAIMNEYDYLSNVDARCRTAIDGYDCEVISNRALTYAHLNARSSSDREHVTSLLRLNPPGWISHGIVLGHLDFSNKKLSADTPEDLHRIRLHYEIVEEKVNKAIKIFGKKSVHRY
jgi:spore coat polysaccharide biosynthesis protein SpsF